MKLSWSAIFIAVVVALSNISLTAQQPNYFSTELEPEPPAVSPVQLASFNNGTLAESAELNAAASTSSDIDGVCNSCVPDSLLCNTLLNMGGSTYKSLGNSVFPLAAGSNSQDNAGLVGGLNTSFRLGQNTNIRGQIGGSYAFYDLKGRDTTSPSSAQQMGFVTAGIYKRSDVLNGDRISWGAVYDQMYVHQYGVGANEVYLGQFRGIAGYAIDSRNEIGGWGTLRANTATITQPTVGAMPVFAATQMNTYWRHNWDYGASTMAYVGLYDRSNVGSWTFGFSGTAPLSNNWSLYGNFAMLMPSSKTGIVGSNEEQWFSSFGLVYYFGGRSVSPTVSGNRTNPLLQVADPSTFQVSN